MTTVLWLTVVLIVFLIALSAFFSGSETALTAASRARLMQMEKAGNRRAGLVGRLIQDRESLIGAVLLGNSLVKILATALATSLFIGLFGSMGVAYAAVVMTLAVVLFGAVLPKTAAVRDPDRTALFVAPAVRVAVVVLKPVFVAVRAVARGLLRLVGYRGLEGKPVLSAMDELRGQVDLLDEGGNFIQADRARIVGLLDLAELEVSDVMVHRTAMRTINAREPAEAIIQEALTSPHTRLPIYEDEAENIVGVIHVKDLLRTLHGLGGDASKLDIKAIATPPWFVPDSTSLTDQLNAFLRNKSHFALVVDEYGEVQGLVTLEDILEEIVGDIADEHDVVVQGVRPQPDGSVNVEGSVPIRDLNRAMDWRLPDEEATTVAGLVIHEARTIPEPGQAFTFHGFKFQVLRKNRNRVTLLRVTPLKPDKDEAAARPAAKPAVP